MNCIHIRTLQWRVVTIFQLVVGLLLSLSALGQPAFLKDGLVAYYPFNGNANDSVGNLNGTLVGATPSFDRFGRPNACYSFNGVGNRVDFSNPPIQSTDNWTITAWVNPANFTQEGIAVQVGFDDGLSAQRSNGYGFGFAKSSAVVGISSGSDGFFSSGTSLPVPGKWYQIVMVRDSVSTKFYINGVKSSKDSTAKYKIPTDFTIGSQNGLRAFSGAIDDVRIYSRALSDADAKELYNYESLPPQNSFLTNGLIAYYPLNGNANDESGNGNHGTVLGGLQFVKAKDTDDGLSAQMMTGSQYITLPNELLRVNDLATTISLWCLFPSNIESPGNLIYLNGPNTAEHSISYSSNFAASSKSSMEQGWNWSTVSDTNVVQTNKWYHIVYSAMRGGKMAIYRNGELAGIADAPSGNYWGDPGYGSAIGAYIQYGSPQLQKRPVAYRNVRLYRRDLSAVEIKSLFTNESAPEIFTPTIVSQPQSQSLTTGNDATFCVVLKDSGIYNYQWQRNEQNINGATLNCYTINSVTAAMDGGRYRVIVSNSAGTIISDTATLSVVTPPPPTIATQPTPRTVQEGANVSLSVVATGQGTLVYQWQFNEQNLPGATSSTLNLNAVKLNTAGRYRVLVSSQYGVTISDTVTLTVNPNPPPTIVTQPLSRTPAEGTQVSLTVTATGIGTLTYQWQVNGQNIPGATSSTLVLSAVRPSVNGNYRVIVGNPYGTTISTEATVAVVVTDSDSDGLSDYEELLVGTNPNIADTDGDGLSDFAEVRTHKSNPLTTDTDGDGYSDGIEVARDGNPNNRSVTPTGALAVFPAVDVEFYTLNGVKYQLEVSSDMAAWTAQGGVVVGTGGNQNHLVRASKATQFWRLKVVP